jgi:hypothetical protein
MLQNVSKLLCYCAAALSGNTAEHALRCSSLAALTTLHHDILKGILRRVVHQVGIASTLEPPLRRLPDLAKVASTSTDGASIRVQARGGHPLCPPPRHHIADVSVIHPLSINTLPAAAATAGVAVARSDQQKRATYLHMELNGYTSVPFFKESYGRLGQPAMALLHQLGDAASVPGWVSRAGSVAGALREVSVGLCRGNLLLYYDSVGVLARASWSHFRVGLHVPTHDLVA